MSRHRLEFTASPTTAKLMGSSFVKPCRKKAPKLRTSVQCAVRTSVRWKSQKTSANTPPSKELPSPKRLNQECRNKSKEFAERGAELYART